MAIKKISKKNLIIIVSIVVIIIMALSISLGVYAYYQNREANGYPSRIALGDYYPVNTEYAYNTDETVPFSMEGQENNPDRGYRWEVYLTLGSGVAYPSDTCDAYTAFNDEQKIFANENIKVVQLYVYLIEYYNKPLDDAAMQQLTEYFEMLRGNGLHVLLRFAYEYTASMNVGPTTGQIESHCKQLKQWFVDQSELVGDTLYAVQLGMVGLWGEGHGSVNNHDLSRITAAVADMMPEPYMIMTRFPQAWNDINKSILNRFSLHDDFLVGIEHTWGLTVNRDSEYFKGIIDLCKSRITDGEMPWGRDTTVPIVDAKLMARQVSEYALTTLSLKHNYTEGGNEFNLKRWQYEYFDKAYLKLAGLPYAPFALQDEKISVFDYFDKHLGYLISASNLKKISDGYEFMLTNYGFNAPHNYKLIIETEEGVALNEYDLSRLSQFGQQKFKINTKGKIFNIRIEHKTNSDITVKLANGIPYIDGNNRLV